MNELNQILQAVKQSEQRGEPCVLATLVRVEGSHYRKPGARALVDAQGKITGSIGGGCLDTDLILHTREVIYERVPRLLHYDSTSDDDIIFGLGLGCGGMVEILLEPLIPGRLKRALSSLMSGFETKEKISMATVIRTDIESIHSGDRMVLKGDHQVINDLDNSEVSDWLRNQLIRTSSHSQPSVISWSACDRRLEVFMEVVCPPIHLAIIGGGNDSLPLATIAETLGWEITVMDHRKDFATAERFPKADRVVTVEPNEILSVWENDLPDAVVVLTHHFRNDTRLLLNLLPLELPYLGVLGSRRRVEKLLNAVEENGLTITVAMRTRLHSPVGLRIPAESPEEIALAIAAEIQQELKGGKHPINSR